MWPFYVYELVDPRTGSVFYVGKGSGDRIDQHEYQARSGVRSAKCDQIREIAKANRKLGKQVVACFFDEQDAYDFETDRIAEYGLENLTNVLPGGQKAWAERQEHKKRRGKIKLLKSKEFVRCIAIWVKGEAGRLRLPDENRPFASALWNVGRKHFPKMWEEMCRFLTFEEIRDALRPFGVEVLRTDAEQEHGQVC